MKSITEIISPIKLLAGHREETQTTGHGCFMDVIAYLNGDAQITDESECVCPVIRSIAIYINDLLNDEQRHRLLPLVARAMGTSKAPIEIIVSRAKAAAKYAMACKTIAKSYTQNENSYSAKEIAIFANESVSAASNAAVTVNENLRLIYATSAARNAIRAAAEAIKVTDSVQAFSYTKTNHFAHLAHLDCKHQIIDAGIECLEEMCPPSKVPDTTVIQRAKDFAEIYKRTVAVRTYAEEAYTRTSAVSNPQTEPQS